MNPIELDLSPNFNNEWRNSDVLTLPLPIDPVQPIIYGDEVTNFASMPVEKTNGSNGENSTTAVITTSQPIDYPVLRECTTSEINTLQSFVQNSSIGVPGAINLANPNQKTYFVAFDGTRNDKNNPAEFGAETNVGLIYDFAKSGINASGRGEARYYSGPGTGLLRLLDSAFGASMIPTADNAYKDLVTWANEQYKSNPDVSITLSGISFSRGGGSHTAFLNYVYDKGIPDTSSNPIYGFDPRTEQNIIIGYERYVVSPKTADLGVQGFMDRVVTGGRTDLTTLLPPSDRLHVRSIEMNNETRREFAADSLQNQTNTDPKINRSILPGDHADGGGGYENNNGISRYVIEGFHKWFGASGLPLTSLPDSMKGGTQSCVIHNSFKGFWGIDGGPDVPGWYPDRSTNTNFYTSPIPNTSDLINSLPNPDPIGDLINSLPNPDPIGDLINSLPNPDPIGDLINSLPNPDPIGDLINSLPNPDPIGDLINSLPNPDPIGDLINSLPNPDPIGDLINSLPNPDPGYVNLEYPIVESPFIDPGYVNPEYPIVESPLIDPGYINPEYPIVESPFIDPGYINPEYPIIDAPFIDFSYINPEYPIVEAPFIDSGYIYPEYSIVPPYTPDYSTPYVPSYTPDYSTPYVPSYTPDYSTPYVPSYTPDYSTPYVPSYTPDYLTPYVPSYTPDYSTSYAPSYTPDYSTPYVPSYTPDYSTPYVPSYTPDYSTPYVPSYTPDYSTPYAPSYTPDYSTPYVPSYTPDYSTPYVPSYTPDYSTPYVPSYTPDYSTPYVPSYTPDYSTPYSPPPFDPGFFEPVVLDLTGKGFNLLAAETSSAHFDILGGGKQYQTGWAGAGNGLLAYDVDNDSLINHRSEIAFIDYKPGARTDLEGLTAFDTNNNGWFEKEDAKWNQFGVWEDKNADGITDSGEYHSLDSLGIQSIYLTSDHQKSVMNGNIIHGVTQVVMQNGSSLLAADVSFNVSGQVLI
jgi:hypothetical protein